MAEASLRKRVHEFSGLVHAVLVMPDHVHVAISLPPTQSLAPVSGEAKGVSAFLPRQRDLDLVREGFV